MPAFEFQVGDLDLASYVRVAEGEGLDPFAAAYLEPQFGESPLAEGQPLVSLDAKNREMAWPLAINAPSKQALHDLIRDLRRELDRPGVLVRWRDSSADAPTFYDLVFGRLDGQFNFRRSEHNWAQGVLRLWVRPYGHTATERVVATGAGSGILLVVTVPSALEGDVAALMDARVTVGSSVPNDGRYVAVAPLPDPAYVPRIPAASLIGLHSTGRIDGASGADGSQVLSVRPVRAGLEELCRFALSPASVYEGRNRVLAVVNQDYYAGRLLRGYDRQGEPLGPFAAASVYGLYGWQLVDLGVLAVGGDQATAVGVIKTKAVPTELSWRSAAIGYPPVGTGSLRINEVIVLPEDDLTFVADARRSHLAVDSFGHGAAASAALTGRRDTYGAQWKTATEMASAPLWVDEAGAGFAIGYSPTLTGVRIWGNRLACGERADMRIEAGIEAGAAAGSAWAEVRKQISDTEFVSARAAFGASGGQYHDLRVVSGASTVAVACQAGQPLNHLALETKGPAIALRGQRLSGASVVAVALSASAALAAAEGEPVVAVRATSLAGNSEAEIDSVRVTDLASHALGPRSIYHFDGPKGRVWKADASDMLTEYVDAYRRGGRAQLPPGGRGNYRGAVLTDNPVSYWRLGEESGTAAADEQAANPGVYTGGVTLNQPGAVAGDSDTAASFDGTSDYINVPDSASLDLTNQVTLEAWVNPTDLTTTRTIISKSEAAYELRIDITTGLLVFVVNGLGAVSATAVTTGQWSHVVATYDGANVRLYINGVLSSTTAVVTSATVNTTPVRIGRRGDGNNFFKGTIDEPAVYDTALPAARVAAHYRAAQPAAAAGVAVLRAPLEYGPANDILSAEIRVRERFTYAR